MKKMKLFPVTAVKWSINPCKGYNRIGRRGGEPPYCSVRDDTYPEDKEPHWDCRIGVTLPIALTTPFIPLITFIQILYYGLDMSKLVESLKGHS